MSFNNESSLYEGYIYCIENNTTHKKYIGQTSTTLQNRYAKHIGAMRLGEDTYLYRAMRLYGIDSFNIYEIHKVVAENKIELQEQLNKYERFYIQELNTFAPSGYNMTQGGRVFSEPTSREVSVVSCSGEVIMQFQSIRSASEYYDVNEKSVHHACNSESHYSSGYYWYYTNQINAGVGETIGSQSRGLHNWKGHTNYLGKRIGMFSDDGELLREFVSASEAERQLNISRTQISKCCYKKCKSAGGYQWAFIMKN